LALAGTVSATAFNAVSSIIHGGPECFPERLTACQRHLSLYPSANCEGLCGLCDLCDAAKVQNPAPGCEYCTQGVDACTATCKAGQAICAKCGIVY